MNRDSNGVNSNDLSESVSSGADPSSYGFPIEIPQDVKHGSGTEDALDAVFNQRRRAR